MKRRLLFSLFILLGLLGGLSAARAADDTIYITIDTDNPAFFERLRRLNNGRDLVYDTTKEAGPKMAKAAGIERALSVVPENEKPPVGANVLHLTWTPSGVLVGYTAAEAKPIYVGKATHQPVDTHHPDRDVIRHRVDTAPLSDRAQIMEEIRIESQLYMAFEMLAKHVEKGATPSTEIKRAAPANVAESPRGVSRA